MTNVQDAIHDTRAVVQLGLDLAKTVKLEPHVQMAAADQLSAAARSVPQEEGRLLRYIAAYLRRSARRKLEVDDG